MANNGRPSKKVAAPLPDPINPLGVRSVYSNSMELILGTLDVRLTFNEIIADHGTITVERRAHVVMPLQHFEAMVNVFNSSFAKMNNQIKKKSEKEIAAEK